MVSPIVDLYVRRKAKKEHRSLPKNYKLILREFAEKYCTNKVKIHYLWLWDAGGRFPNASATIPGVILINSVWVSLLIDKYADKTTTDAFKMTISHEMTHQENEFFYIEPFSRNQKFVNWINEIHADYGGIIKAFDGDANRGINALEFKKKCKGEKDKDGRSHPSWKRRIAYIRKYDFNDDLIKKVAEITGCKNQKLINKLCMFYDNIELRRIA